MKRGTRFFIQLLLFALLIGLLISLFLIFFYDPDNLEKNVQELASSWSEKKSFRLEQSLTKRLRRAPNEKTPEYRLLLGRLLFYQSLNSSGELSHSRLDRALKLFLANLDTTNRAHLADNRFWAGMTYYKKGPSYYLDSRNNLIQAIKNGFPDRLKAIKILNYIDLKNKDYDSIINVNAEYLKQGYFDPDILYTLGRAFREKKQTENALSVYLQVTNLQNQTIGLAPTLRAEAAECLYLLNDPRAKMFTAQLISEGYTNKRIIMIHEKLKEQNSP